MTKRRKNILSTSSQAEEEMVKKEAPRGMMSLGERLPRGPRGTASPELMAVVRAEWESGSTVESLAEKHSLSSRTIHRWKTKEKWKKDPEQLKDYVLEKARAVVQAKVVEASEEAEAAIELVVARQKATSSTLAEMLQEAMSKALAYPHEDSFRQLLIIKVATEVARNIQMMDRKTWGLDDKSNTKTTALYEVLNNMEETVERKAIKVEETYGE
jgi:transcriptional regulator GlxA family with amidase domain